MTTTTTDKIVTLRELPVTVNVTKIAEGMLSMFTDEERTVLRFGMLPAKKMEILESQLRDKFDRLGMSYADVYGNDSCAAATDKDVRLSRVSTEDGYEIREWSIKKLISEATHEISLAIYAIGDLIV